MKKFVIFVEGKADATFIRDYLSFLFSDLIIKKDNELEKELKSDNLFIKIIVTRGYSAIVNKLKTRLEEIKDYNYNILVIQDADNNIKDPSYGGKNLRTKYLEEIKKEYSVDFEIFLFPNNQDDGDLEDLLLKIVNNEHFDLSHRCYVDYSKALKDFAPINHCNELLENKQIIFTYFRTFHGIDGAREKNRKYLNEFWDLENKNLNVLKEFILSNINKSG